MSEMQANQYFISGRYSEALSEYSKLAATKENDVVVKEKMIISAALTENFALALSLLDEIVTNYSKFLDEINIDADTCFYNEIVKKLEMQKVQKKRDTEVKNMKIAILMFFPNQNKAMKYFKKLKDSSYADLINSFLKSINNLTN